MATITSLQPGDQLSHNSGPKGDVPIANLTEFVFSNPFQHSFNTFTSPSRIQINPCHSFAGQTIPPQKPILYNAGTGASITWERLKGDSLRLARSINSLVGKPLPFDGQDNDDRPIHSPKTTVLVCLPNCLAFAPIILGSWAALCTVSTVSALLMPDELAHILAKTRPQILFVSAGEDGEGRMLKALEKVLEGKLTNVKDSRVMQKAQTWAKELMKVWQTQRSKQFQRGELSPNSHKRVFIVNIGTTYGGPADYYGTSARKDGVSVLSNPNDWSNLLAPPQGHRQGESLDSLARPAFTFGKMNRAEQKRRTALILWSSGTTGPSKGVLLSHFAVISSITSLWNGLPVLHGTPFGGETWIALAPWTHMYGIMVILLPAVAIGATIIMPASPRFDLAEYLQVVEKYKVTNLHVSPPVIVHLKNLLLEQKRKGKLNVKMLESVRSICCGGAPTSYAAIQTIYDYLGKPVHQAYGSTETGSTSHATAIDYASTNTAAQMEMGTVGTPLPNVEISIRAVGGCTKLKDIERRRSDVIREVENGGLEGRKRKHALNGRIPGEIWVRANGNMQGYYSGLGSDEDEIDGALDKQITSNTITQDGWIKTGDEGILDNQGQLWIVGRIKELIKVKGFQVAPVEMDSVFGKHEEVNDAAAVGVMDKDGGEEICMYIVPRKETILQDVRAQEQLVKRLTDYIVAISAYYKWPKYFVICSQLIKNPTGKILRKDLHTLPGKRHIAPRPSTNKKMVLEREAKL